MELISPTTLKEKTIIKSQWDSPDWEKICIIAQKEGFIWGKNYSYSLDNNSIKYCWAKKLGNINGKVIYVYIAPQIIGLDIDYDEENQKLGENYSTNRERYGDFEEFLDAWDSIYKNKWIPLLNSLQSYKEINNSLNLTKDIEDKDSL